MSETFRWSADGDVRVVDMFVASIGMTLPIVLSAAAGKLPLGIAVSLGTLLISGVGIASDARQPFSDLVSALAATVCAALAATVVVGHGRETLACVLGVVGVAALVGGYSRPMAQTATRFILFFVIAAHAAAETSHQLGLLFLVIAGALWATALHVASDRLMRRRTHSATPAVAMTTTSRAATRLQNFQRWKRSLATLAGWHYTLRIMLCVALASFLQAQWPDHHFAWIAVVAIILTRRQIEVLPVQATQRAIGTLLGVLIACPLLVYNASGWGVVIGVAVLSAARPLFKARNYLAYSMVMTPLILLILADAEPLRAAVFYDRVFATMLGIGAVVVLNLLFIRAVSKHRGTSRSPVN